MLYFLKRAQVTVFPASFCYPDLMTKAPIQVDVIIIGGGPAGLTAAIYTGRANLKTVVLEKGLPGGQIAQTEEVENYPGFPDPIPGPELAERMVKQAEKFGATIEMEEVQKIEHQAGVFTVTGYDEAYQARAVILSTGANPKRLNVPGEELFWGKGVSTCATLLARRLSRRWTTVTVSANLVRNSPSSTAASPPPTTTTCLPR